MAAGKPWSPEEDRIVAECWGNGMGIRDIMPLLPGRTATAIQKRPGVIGVKFGQNVWAQKPFTVEPIPSAKRPREEVIAAQIVAYSGKRAHHETKRDGVQIAITDPGPYAIALFGDPHVDDSGADLETLIYNMDVVRRTPHMYAGNIGDLTNNWVGKLARLFGHQQATEDEARDLLDWLVGYLDWLFVILGNHDKWTTSAEVSCRAAGVTYVSHGAKFRIQAGDSELIIDARHDHHGRSQYLSQFGQVKSNWRGNPAHIIVAGHTHTGGSSYVKNGSSGRVAHCIRLGAFKRYDDYADQLGFSDDSVGPCCVAVVDPSVPDQEPGFIQLFWDIERAALYLGMLRGLKSHI